MTEAERARRLADVAERDGYIDISQTMPDDAEDMRIWIKGARLLASQRPAPSSPRPGDDIGGGLVAVPKEFVSEVAAVVTTFKESEAQGYRSKDRQFVIDVLGMALRLKAERAPIRDVPGFRKPPLPAVDVSALRLQAAVDAMEFAVEEGGVEFLKAWLEDDTASIRREWPSFDMTSLRASKRPSGQPRGMVDPRALAAEAAALAVVGAGRGGVSEEDRPGMSDRLRAIYEAETILPQAPPNPCCFDIPGSGRVRGRDEPCAVCLDRNPVGRPTDHPGARKPTG